MKALSLLLTFSLSFSFLQSADFGPDWENLDSAVNGRWWEKTHTDRKAWLEMVKVPRDEVVGFAIYTIDRGTVKMTAQMYPLYPDESRQARLELLIDGEWQQVASALIYELGWSAHFRIDGWDESKSVPYRVRHGEEAQFEGVLRANDKSKNEIVRYL